jgi:hypothetical protein
MIEKREDQRENSQGSLTGAPYLAKIIGHADLLFQGGLEVVLIRDSGNQVGNESQTYFVKYASPFYGCTPFEFTGQNVTADDSQMSYGFWGVPPDTGITGIVIFIDGKPDQGYWVASVQDKFQNHMVPAIGGTTVYKTDDDYKQAEHPLPVVEHNRKANEGDKNLEIDKIPRAVHPIATRFKTQGLTRDEVRGTSTSTSRRDVPNMVFGMSSPGPLNRNGKKKFLGNRESPTPSPVPVQRLGGTHFVMDDGDDRYYREKKPTDGAPTYVKNPEGLKDIPYNEHFRIRTRTGHQLLFHNSEDLIYIGNSRGTAWIEFTSDGKIDIYAEDSINIRTKQDFNFVADRDFNIEVGRNFNLKVNGEMHTHVLKDHILIVDENQKIHIKKDVDKTYDKTYKHLVKENVDKVYKQNYKHLVTDNVNKVYQKNFTHTVYNSVNENFASQSGTVKSSNGGNTDVTITGNLKITQIGTLDHTVTGYRKLTTGGGLDINTTGSTKISSSSGLDINTTGSNKFTASGNTEVNSGGENLTSASRIANNRVIEAPSFDSGTGNAGTAATASTASSATAAAIAEQAESAVLPKILKTHSLPDLLAPNEDDVDKTVIVRRMPTAEPYPWHENLDATKVKPGLTDRDVDGRYEGESSSMRTPPSDWRKYKKPSDTPF